MERPSLFALLALLFTPSCVIVIGDFDRESARVQRSAEFDTQGASTLRVECRNGSITVAQGGPTVEVDATLTVNGPDRAEANRMADQLELRSHREDDVLRVFVDVPDDASGWSATMQLRVPAGMALDLDSSNGKIVLQDSFPSVRAETSNGTIIARCDGEAWLDTSNGRVQLIGAPQSFWIDTSNAGVTVDLAGDWNGKGEVRTSNGPIRLNCSGRVRCATTARTSNGPVTGVRDLRGEPGVGELTLRTSNASITVSEAL